MKNATATENAAVLKVNTLANKMSKVAVVSKNSGTRYFSSATSKALFHSIVISQGRKYINIMEVSTHSVMKKGMLLQQVLELSELDMARGFCSARAQVLF